MKLSLHFTLEELTRSDTAARLGIDNTPPEDVVDELRKTAGRLEIVRQILRVSIFITSGFRCEQLEKVLARAGYLTWCRRSGRVPCAASWAEYFARKQHPKGRAADWRAPDYGTPLAACVELAKHGAELEFDQLIHEFGSWGHIGWPAAGEIARLQLLTINAAGTKLGLS